MLTIIEKKEEPLLSRTFVKAQLVESAVTPSNEQAKESLAKELSIDQNLIAVKKIVTFLGSRKVDILAYAYATPEDLKDIEKHKNGRGETEGKEEKNKPEMAAV